MEEQNQEVEQINNIPPQEEPKKKKKLLVIICILLILSTLGLTVYYFISSDKEDSLQENEEIAEIEEIPSLQPEPDVEYDLEILEPTYSEYSGKYINTELPKGWRIVEYENGDGSDIVKLGIYTGLTGISVFTDENAKIFKIDAVDGIGGPDYCEKLVSFKDTPASYIEHIKQNIHEIAGEMIVEEIPENMYTEFTFLDYRARRVGSVIYWDSLKNTNLNEFHTLCGIESLLLMFENLSFGCNDYICDSYEVRIEGNHTEEKLSMLERILDGMVLK
jgi:hypothetical protein